jgi:hypothetical protein
MKAKQPSLETSSQSVEVPSGQNGIFNSMENLACRTTAGIAAVIALSVGTACNSSEKITPPDTSSLRDSGLAEMPIAMPHADAETNSQNSVSDAEPIFGSGRPSINLPPPADHMARDHEEWLRIEKSIPHYSGIQSLP